MKRVAVLVPSFSLRDDEPNPCNVRLAKETFRTCDRLLAKGYMPVLVAQWEVDLALRQLREIAEFDDEVTNEELVSKGIVLYAGSVGQLEDGRYLGTKEVYAAALPLFEDYGCRRIVIVAQPFLHKPYAYWLARKDFRLRWMHTRWIGFDPASTQEWCRGWWPLTVYTVQTILGLHGQNRRQVNA